MKIMKIPQKVLFILKNLKESGFEAYVVGGCVRDILMKREPQDWDIATNAKPSEVIKIFPNSFCNNRFLTVTVLTGEKNERLKEVEVTTFRKESKYTDKRHPDFVSFAKTIQEDLSRRDFTINAMAIDVDIFYPEKETIIDPFRGMLDLKKRIIRAVGDPYERFSEDALRLLRAVRFAITLGEGWKIEKGTEEAIKKNASLISLISKERIRDEFTKIIMSKRAKEGIELLRRFGLLKEIIPEIEEGYGVTQNKHHIYNCYEHYLNSLDFAAKKDFNLHVRLAALFHDIGKPRTKRGEGPDATFYGHEIVGAKMTSQILNRLKFPKKDIEKITRLVRYHLFYYNPGEVKEASVRRLIRNVGLENIEELLQLRMADRIGSGVPKAEPYKLRHLRYMIEKVSKDPISVKMLNIDGNEVMEILKIPPGPKVGYVLEVLLNKVLENPKKNQREILVKEVKKLGSLTDKELETMAKKAKEERERIQQKEDEMTRRKYWVV